MAMLGCRARDGSDNEKIVAAGFPGSASLDVSEKTVPGIKLLQERRVCLLQA
jgi:hypothetical protein